MDLFELISEDKLQELRKVIGAGANLNVRSESHGTPLSMAIWLERTEMVDLLLAAGADVNAQGVEETPLQMAADEGNVELLTNLLQRGADLSAQDPSLKKTALHFAVEEDHHSIAQLLLDAGAELERSDYLGQTALMTAIFWGHFAMVDRLLNAGANPNHSDAHGATPLMLASQMHQLDTAARLLEAGADPRVVAQYGETAITKLLRGADESEAEQGVRLRLLELLLTRGADPNDRLQQEHSTPLMIAAEQGWLQAVELLVHHGADVTAANRKGRTALQLAARKGHSPVVDYLRKVGDDSPIKDENYLVVALMEAARHGDVDRLSRFLAAGVEVKSPDPDPLEAGCAALMHAARFGHAAAVEMLLQAGADPHAKEREGPAVGDNRSALHLGVESQKVDVVRLLIRSGANPHVTDRQGLTPLAMASTRGCSAIVKELLAAPHDQTPAGMIEADRADALVNAARFDHSDAVRLLLAAGVCVNSHAADETGCTPLIAACRFRTKFVVTSETDLVNLDQNERSRWVKTGQQRQLEMLEHLLQQGADVNARDKRGCTALLTLCKLDTSVNLSCRPDTGVQKCIYGEIDPRPAIALLLAHGADINAQNQQGETALLCSVRNSASRLVALLLKAGADANLADYRGQTPLMIAAGETGSVRIVQDLLKAGVNVNARDQDGQTALSIALEVLQTEIAELLRNAGAVEEHTI